MISMRPAETIKSEQLQNKEFKLTSCQPLLVFFLGGRCFLLIFSFELCRIHDVLFD